MNRPNLRAPIEEKKTAFLAYIPVLHHGYIEWFAQYPTVKHIFLLSPHVVKKFGPSHKHIHGLSVLTMQRLLDTLHIFSKVSVIDEVSELSVFTEYETLLLPNEVITKQFTKKYLPDNHITLTSIFLRWDRDSSKVKYDPHPDRTIYAEKVSDQFMQIAQELGAKSSDWWRHVGAIAVKNGRIIGQAYNTHLPSEQTPYIEGDGRAEFHQGDHMDITTAIHAEARLVAEAAANGVALAGADLYVTDFPCPTCAKLIAAAKFSKVYYLKGYAVFDGERILNTAGIEIIKIEDQETE